MNYFDKIDNPKTCGLEVEFYVKGKREYEEDERVSFWVEEGRLHVDANALEIAYNHTTDREQIFTQLQDAQNLITKNLEGFGLAPTSELIFKHLHINIGLPLSVIEDIRIYPSTNGKVGEINNGIFFNYLTEHFFKLHNVFGSFLVCKKKNDTWVMHLQIDTMDMSVLQNLFDTVDSYNQQIQDNY